ncbi:amylo-alpha-1,6-glucosidase [Sulfurifustis variabilis]|uniref:Amylo-alpha-1,6-glucosidase n=1 Tax=Sulfurifustis variabilis TaxID=1675686 RepID=A0A1B4V1Q7_9GAMM|nr:glycogen debranching N-terminal domain-containing protein [Sulfurifustis variabilis]BAU47373.1 amylo-alpha-1,6-glucosidase [Sulfurifustis variabilis]
MEEILQIGDRWYVLATTARAGDRTRVLKHGDTFAVFDRNGDIHPYGAGDLGVYHDGTRFLSHFELRVNGERPMLLHSTLKQDNSLLVVDLTTPDLYEADRILIRKGTLHLFRGKLLHEGVHYEHVRVVNYGQEPIDVGLDLRFGCDYADIFEVRGVRRERRGEPLPVEHRERALVLGYRGLDGVVRRTRITLSDAPDGHADGSVHYALRLAPRAQRDLYASVACEYEERAPAVISYDRALAKVEEELAASAAAARVYTSNEQFNDWTNRSFADMRMLISHTPEGRYPYAGVPWYSTPFGRDGILAAMQMLLLDPDLARGVLAYLGARQAEAMDPACDAEPGKVLHETRRGEMAALREVPFGRYYGSVDATPLYVVLAGAYYERTGDRDFIEQIRGPIERALAWIDWYGDADGDGFVEYVRHSANGLVQQGWKDSEDSVFHADGSMARGPIALCEVQGYVYAAKLAAARLFGLLGEKKTARALAEAAAVLKSRFGQAFWCEDIDTYALALDGDKTPCRVQASNAGHALAMGIATPEHASRIGPLLLSEAFYSGWGVRTLAHGERRYNPMSYHNGSIWPHDNALIALGLARYGLKDLALEVLTGLFDATIVMDLHRLPELFCGFERLPGQAPTLYPVACSPQAWASGAVFQLLQACLGISFSAEKPQLRFDHPVLPEYLHWVELHNVPVGDGQLDLVVRRHAQDVSVSVLRKDGDIEVAVIV